MAMNLVVKTREMHSRTVPEAEVHNQGDAGLVLLEALRGDLPCASPLVLGAAGRPVTQPVGAPLHRLPLSSHRALLCPLIS